MIPDNFELYGTRNQLFLYIDQDCYTRVLCNDKIEFGKLTAIPFKKHHLPISTNSDLYVKYKEWFEYLKENYYKFRIIWNISGKEDEYYKYKQGELYIKNINKSTEPWDLVCHHLGSYRRYGYRSYNDSFKLGVAGLNVNIFRKLKKMYDKK